jgi:hypothetical protein
VSSCLCVGFGGCGGAASIGGSPRLAVAQQGASGDDAGGIGTVSSAAPVSSPAPATSPAPASSPAPATAPVPFRFFSPSSFWNEPLSADARLAPKSAALVAAFSAEIAKDELRKDPPWINTTSESVPIYTVPATQPTVRVTLVNGAKSPALQAAWAAVPLPPEAHPAAGTDKVLVVWQPSTDRLWDFWRLQDTVAGWSASWGGAMQDVSADPGVYGPQAWPGAKPWWGDSASSLEPVGGLISLEDLQLGQINHALGIAVPNVRAGVYASPAQRTDGKSTAPLALPEGAHLRLDPRLDVAALHLPRITTLIAEAAQRYGLYVRDHAPDVTFYAQDPTPTGTDPYIGPGGYFEGEDPKQLLALFPWSHLEVLRMTLHRVVHVRRRRSR